jgi:hypothetical protein
VKPCRNIVSALVCFLRLADWAATKLPHLVLWVTRRTIDGLKPLVRLLEMASAQGVVMAALDALRAASMNNDDNKAAAASCWLVPQLVKLIGTEVGLPCCTSRQIEAQPYLRQKIPCSTLGPLCYFGCAWMSANQLLV